MNVNFKLKIPLISNEDNSSKILNVDTQLMLTPFYVLEGEVITPFQNIKEEQLPWVRQVIFTCSLEAYRETKKIEDLKFLPTDELFMLRHDYTLCLVKLEVGKQVNKDIGKQLSRSKELADFSVSTSTKGDSAIVGKIIDDANDCIDTIKEEIKQIIEDHIKPIEICKGKYNSNTRKPQRLWWTSELPLHTVDGYADRKYFLNGKGYKASTFNLDSYLRYEYNPDTLAYYRGLEQLMLGGNAYVPRS